MLASEFLQVEVVDPAASDRYYTGYRFTPLAAVLRVRSGNHEFLYNPVRHDPALDVAGLMAEFDLLTPGGPPGYTDAKVGEGFVKIGVGVLERASSDDYRFAAEYKVLSRATTTTHWRSDSVVSTQDCTWTSGLGYSLRSETRVSGKIVTIDWELTNTGSKSFRTEHYAHNCFAFDALKVGPGYRLTLPYDFTVKGLSSEQKHVGRSILFEREIPDCLNAVIPYPAHYPGENQGEVAHSESGHRIAFSTSLPGLRLAIHARNYYLNPEQFVAISLEPGERKTWRRTYEFEFLPPEKQNP